MTSSGEDDAPPANDGPATSQAVPAHLNGDADTGPISGILTAQAEDRDAAPELLPPTEPSTEIALAGGAHDVEEDQPANDELPLTAPQAANLADPAAAAVFQQQAMVPPEISLMMALAQISASQIIQAPTVAPAQVSLASKFHEGGDGLDMGNGAFPGTAVGGPGLESFARIDFADSVFQMTTYAVIIGRDQRALEQARRDEKRAQEHQRRVEEHAALGLPPPSPPSHDLGKFSKSYVSEEGGMLGPESDGEDNQRPAKRRKTSTGARSVSGTPHQAEQAPQVQQALQDKNPNIISNRQYVSHTPGAAAVDLASLRPSPYHVPLIGIHSPGPNIASRTKAISREHLKIQFNQERGVFEAIPLHKNGFFCDDVHYRDTKVVLKCGDRLQIKDVDFVFVINGVPHGRTGAEEYFDEEETSSKRYSEGGKEMSFEFESSHGGEIRDTSEEESEVEVEEDADEDGGEVMEDEEEDDEEEDQVMATIEGDDEATRVKPEPGHDQELLPPPPPKKRGPGRPPKNGIRSKREERLLKKQAMELAKKSMPAQPPPGEPPVKRKVGRPRKHPLPENAGDRPEKRKYKPRKPKNADGAEGSDVEKMAKEKRREKPKTPPLELKLEDFTAEQMQKPTKNYGLLIDEVLTAALPDGLTLKQIYKRIQKRYPYYYFTVDTKGWESSVRHNLIGNEAFKKDEVTHLWCRVPGIELDAGKKRKATSPDHHASAFHGAGQQPYGSHPQRAPIYRHSAHLGTSVQPQGMMNPALPAVFQGPNGMHYPPTQAPHHSSRAGGQPPPGRPPYQAAGMAAVVNGGASRAYQQGSAAMPYSSPFMSSRPAAPPPVQASGIGGVAGAQQSNNILPRHGQGPPLPGMGHGNGPVPPGAMGSGGAARQNPSLAHTNGNAAVPLKPAIDQDAATYINNFKAQVVEQLQRRTPKAEIIALSAINRGVGLATRSPVPDLDSMESIVLGIFQQTIKARFPAPTTAPAAATSQESGSASAPAPAPPPAQAQILHPALLQALLRFKAAMVETLKAKLGETKAEALLLSAIDQVLGFSAKCTAQPADEAERKEFEAAELVLMPHIKDKVAECQRLLSR